MLNLEGFMNIRDLKQKGCNPSGEIGPSLHGSGTRAYQPTRAAQDQGTD